MNDSRESIRKAKLTDRQIDIRTYNAMVDFVKSRGVPTLGEAFVDQFGHLQAARFHPQRQLWWPCVSDDAIDPFGIVEVYDAQPAGQDFYFNVRRATSAAKLYAGNEDYKLFAKNVITGEKGFGWIKLITPFEPVTVISSDLTVKLFTEVIPDGSDHVTAGSGAANPSMISYTKPEAGTGKVGVIARTAGSGSSSCDTIRFRLATTLPGNPYSAICFPHAVPVGFTLADVPGLTPLGSVVVCDPQCSFFNEPNENLLNRLGWAKYMQPLVPTVCQPGYYTPEPQWEVFSLGCVVNPSCSSEFAP